MSSEPPESRQRGILREIARRAMLERGLAPDFPAPALVELARLPGPAKPDQSQVRDLRELPWCSIDNDDSRDLDQLTVAEQLSGAAVKIRVAIADVDALVRKGSALDAHAGQNTTSVYTPGEIFPMLPERLSTDLTSLNPDGERLALVAEMVFGDDGSLRASDVYRAAVLNHAQLTYRAVAAWLEGEAPAPPALSSVSMLEENLRLQDHVAQTLKAARHEHGALDLQTVEARPVFSGEELQDLEQDRPNRAKDLIADFMIAANGVTARFLAERRFPSIRRVVRTPKRWSRIVELAEERGATLPRDPDPVALERFLTRARAADPDAFPDLSLSVIKLLGAGEYAVQAPGDVAIGHFGLAVRDYGHSTAPNRRFPDLVTQRLLKAAIAGGRPPYTVEELEPVAEHCTQAEDAAKKVERQVEKSAAAMLLQSRVGERFEAFVTGASEKGTWVRIARPPVEGRLDIGHGQVDVGQRLTVRLVSTDVERGYIDFARAR